MERNKLGDSDSIELKLRDMGIALPSAKLLQYVETQKRVKEVLEQINF